VLKKDMTIITLREEVPFVDFVIRLSPHQLKPVGEVKDKRWIKLYPC